MLTRMRLKNLKTWGEQLWSDGVELSAISLFSWAKLRWQDVPSSVASLAEADLRKSRQARTA